ncbi:MAG: hypothetical protein GF308_00075 [Candidatus Heimdallarchaeota archaeon]|nr:hypothetical protein [Candidatus Heimdallarchaeota archaeon]
MVILLILIFTSGSVPLQASGYTVNDSASWFFGFYFLNEDYESMTTNITIVDEDESSWQVNVLFIDLNEYLPDLNYSETLLKQGDTGGFLTTATDYYWLLWVDLSQISEGLELVTSKAFFGIPYMSIPPPITFEVEKAEFKMSNKIFAVWAFISDGFSLFYDINTGLLLMAIYDWDTGDGLKLSKKLELVDSSIPITTTKAGTLFTFDILIIAVSIIALVSFWYRKKGKLNKTMGSLQQKRIRRN